MKPLHLNVASRPWQNTKPLWITTAVAAAVILFLLVNNVQAAWRYFVETEETRAEIAEVNGEAIRAKQHADALESRLAGIDRGEMISRIDFVNRQITERAFSWSLLLDHLEDVLPNDVRLLNLRPSIDPEGTTHLTLTCVARNQDAFVDTIRNLTADPYFHQPYPLSEVTDEGQLRFVLRVDYRPDPRGVVLR
jgi:Tfp pilus assembly protein PilN